MSPDRYVPAWWIPGPHAQTLWGKLVRSQPMAPSKRLKWTTPDGDFIEVHRLAADPDAPRLILLHGLEGTVRSHYAQGFMAEAGRRGWGADLLIFRSCGSEPNLTRRFYHSGETSDLSFVIDRVTTEFPDATIGLAGVSLGGNVLLKYLGEVGRSLPAAVLGAAAISVPFDLARSSRHIDRGFARVYQFHFLRSLRKKALAKAAQFPDLATVERIGALRTLVEFDDAITAPAHGFADAGDYYQRSSSLGFLKGIRVPTLLLSSRDDPFLPPAVLDEVKHEAEGNSALNLEFREKGGHAGFVGGRNPLRPFYYAEFRVGDFLAPLLERSVLEPVLTMGNQ